MVTTKLAPKLTPILLALVLMLGATHCYASIITWGAATNVVDSTDVATNGNYVDAMYTVNSGSNQTIGDTIFHGQSQTVAPTEVIETTSQIEVEVTGPPGAFGNNLTGGTLPGTVTGAYATVLGHLDYGYNDDSDSGSYTHHGTITLSGLTVGHRYQLQVWSIQRDPTFYVTSYTSGANTVALNLNPGQYALGFNADATTQTLTFARTGGGQFYYAINALALREVPEPGSFGILGLGLAGSLSFIRRRRNGETNHRG